MFHKDPSGMQKTVCGVLLYVIILFFWPLRQLCHQTFQLGWITPHWQYNWDNISLFVSLAGSAILPHQAVHNVLFLTPFTHWLKSLMTKQAIKNIHWQPEIAAGPCEMNEQTVAHTFLYHQIHSSSSKKCLRSIWTIQVYDLLGS